MDLVAVRKCIQWAGQVGQALEHPQPALQPVDLLAEQGHPFNELSYPFGVLCHVGVSPAPRRYETMIPSNGTDSTDRARDEFG